MQRILQRRTQRTEPAAPSQATAPSVNARSEAKPSDLEPVDRNSVQPSEADSTPSKADSTAIEPQVGKLLRFS